MSYSEVFKEHLAHPCNGGEIDDANAVADETNPVCGDRVRLSLKVAQGLIKDARFLAYGCPPTLVCASVLMTMIKEKRVDVAVMITKSDLIDAIGGLPSRKHHAAALVIETLRTALEKL